ncbi:hypothetical protein E1301_Tti019064 [Triplophysa tibetana]|uniref:Uncharacterized protein n=1 Tax=Triplophysa tibetana TaxID=1572043 RepID=A0A5A9NS44_9TELE|nr:hypothetical protein E1301_Tti019064 [Triplophysa tibetana]
MKNDGKIVKKTISQLSKAQQEKMRQQWRDYQKKHREGTRILDKIMNFTPESMNSSAADDPVDLPVEAQPNPPDQEYANMFVQDGKQPQASSTPEKEIRVKKRCRILQKEKAYLRKEMLKLKRQLAATKQTSEKLRKSLERLKKGKKTVSERNKPRGTKKLALERKEEVVKFLCRDENSRLLPGKKDTITKNKNKQQRRVLTKSLTELHVQYNSEIKKPFLLSYRQFVRHCPFYVTPPKASDRNTCACLDHENVKLLVDKLHQKGLLQTARISELLTSIVCDPQSKDCMYRICAKCCYNEIEVAVPQEEVPVTWQQWSRETKSDGQKTFTNFAKTTQSGTWSNLFKLFSQKLDSLAKHHFNWLHQAKEFRALKETLTEDEVCLHVDFSENFSCKLNSKVQSFHFGGSRKQATVHTCVAYTAHGCQSYATISSSLRHDERAIWAHIEPLLKDVRESTVPFLSGIKRVTWNFAEKSHGKGAPDGVGGAVKRVADSAVQGGADVQTPEHLYKLLKEKESSIKYYWISDEDIKRYDEALPDSVLAVKGTLKIHQVTTAQPGKIQHREISCFCSRPDICQCHNPSEVDFQNTTKVPPTSLQAKENPKDLNGKFVLVEYDGQPFVGQVLKVVGNEIEEKWMPVPVSSVYNSTNQGYDISCVAHKPMDEKVF